MVQSIADEHFQSLGAVMHISSLCTANGAVCIRLPVSGSVDRGFGIMGREGGGVGGVGGGDDFTCSCQGGEIVCGTEILAITYLHSASCIFKHWS